MKKLIFALLIPILLAAPGSVLAQVTGTANDAVPAYTAPFQYGINADYTNEYWTDQRLAKIAADAGSSTIRLALYDHFLEQNGINVRQDAFNYYVDTLHFTNTLVFLNGAANDHLEGQTYPGCSSPSLLFKNMYLPAFIDSAGTQVINRQNFYALYVYNVVKNYGRGVKFYEVWNEPDFTNTSDGDALPGVNGNWWDNAPAAADLSNMNAPVFSYIRMLRLTYQVVKTLNPGALVATGGIGYPSFMDAILRYTDNPAGGSVSPAYPLAGGAYFDVLSFHSYPFYDLATPGPNGSYVFPRHSDGNADRFILERNSYEKLTVKYGYDGVKFPKKIVICTETNVPSRPDPADATHWGSPEMQKNYVIKCLVESQANTIRQLYLYELADGAGSTPIDVNDYMGLYNPLFNVQSGGETLTQEGIAHLTTTSQLAGLSYDQALTASLALDPKLGGAAFSGNIGKKNIHKFVLWAKTGTDMSETASGTYSFPPTLQTGSMLRSYTWDAGKDSTAYKKISSLNVPLTGSPLFLVSDSLAATAKSIKANTGPAISLKLPVDSTLLDGSASTASGTTITSYAWKQTAGVSSSIRAANQSKTEVTGLKAGVYTFQLKVSDASGLSDSSALQVTVAAADTSQTLKANAGPNQTVKLPQDTARLDGSASNSSGSGSLSFLWKQTSGPVSAPINTPSSVSPLVQVLRLPGNYTFQLNVRNTQGKADSASVTIQVLPADSNLLNPAAGLIVYPNPVSTVMTMRSGISGNGILTYKLYSLTGALVFTGQSDKNSSTWLQTLDMRNLASGIYILRITLGSKYQTTSVIKY